MKNVDYTDDVPNVYKCGISSGSIHQSREGSLYFLEHMYSVVPLLPNI